MVGVVMFHYLYYFHPRSINVMKFKINITFISKHFLKVVFVIKNSISLQAIHYFHTKKKSVLKLKTKSLPRIWNQVYLGYGTKFT